MGIDQKARQDAEILMATTFPEIDFDRIDARRQAMQADLRETMARVDFMASVYASPTCRKFRNKSGKVVLAMGTMRNGKGVNIRFAKPDGSALFPMDEVLK